MTDRELLEAAAKAAGIDVHIVGDGTAGGEVCFYSYPDMMYWNPLTDDGDAFRLLVKLRLELGFPSDHLVWAFARGGDVCREHPGTDPYAATRRAIVRAAAALGEPR